MKLPARLSTPAATIAAGIATLVALSVMGWFVALNPGLSSISEAEGELTDAQDRNMLVLGQLNQLRSQLEDLDATRDRADELSELLPPTADQPGFFKQVTDAAKSAGIPARDVTTISPGVPTILGEAATPADPTAAAEPAAPDPSALAVQTVTITASGRYGQIEQMLDRLEVMPRAFLTRTIAVDTEGDEGGQARFALVVTGNTFVAPPLTEPDLEDIR